MLHEAAADPAAPRTAAADPAAPRTGRRSVTRSGCRPGCSPDSGCRPGCSPDRAEKCYTKRLPTRLLPGQGGEVLLERRGHCSGKSDGGVVLFLVTIYIRGLKGCFIMCRSPSHHPEFVHMHVPCFWSALVHWRRGVCCCPSSRWHSLQSGPLHRWQSGCKEPLFVA